ncbi:5-amino-6-(D-ribitylamino)uracil--L-tyrosine 4-hydroxyphenyl transferase CofH [Aromatoleum toluclasticum]|uniref:5-amino-6-(D-ribitylamino)uracil--L-tyrosine 4-hydroxyphenyl transferase CofH n=1 Tax=Aromatoleum toluclasticum TaxID=92003 RepID=UPI001D18445C|nr:5-amino-6-(D-ribitylamino)uracil--L-tyrosine 4-hydroxyphenyl transferase CofH [Aromatoleum toluclasticum]MCC4114724.1 5-amino-6-(D-ribitylamino)uracil--L-tyrosine 4-hydroxyphenyl transferase CofH [Aromatoleum toluclasticum]
MNAPAVVSLQSLRLDAAGEIRPRIRAILDKALAGEEVGADEAVALFGVEGAELDALTRVADRLRERAVGDNATFVVTRNINYTNVCNVGCKFCNFAKRRDDPEAEFFDLDEIVRRAQEAADRGATEVCIQGGLHPDIPGGFYRDIVKAIKARLPDLHIHAFSPFEIWYGARKSRMSYRDFIQDLIDQGLGSMPGTAAEILDDDVRRRLTMNKLSTQEWVEIVKTAHGLGLPTTSTIMYGHIDGPRQWANHLALLRDIQKETGGFTEFVPLGFIHYKTRLFRENPDVRPGPTRLEHIRMHAVARIMLAGWIDNIQASWVKLGPELARDMLAFGVNDLGGTLMNESISRAAGATHGQEMLPEELVRMIRSAGRHPVRRSTLYRHLEAFDAASPPQLPVLAPASRARRTIPIVAAAAAVLG